MPELIERAAQAMLAELKRQSEGRVGGPYVDDGGGCDTPSPDLSAVAVDGCVDLLAVARAAIDAALTPSE